MTETSPTPTSPTSPTSPTNLDGQDTVVQGTRGRLHVAVWPARTTPRYIAVFVHGYADHSGRYARLAQALVDDGAVVHAPDQLGCGRSEGERAVVVDYEDVVTDLDRVIEAARTAHPHCPIVLIGHSLGGMVAVRHAQRFPGAVAGLVLAAPVLGTWQTATMLLGFDEIPELPYDLAPLLTRDPVEGAAYNADPLVWHGPFRRVTLEAVVRCLAVIEAAGDLGGLPVLWLHGDQDRIAPRADAEAGLASLRGHALVERRYPGGLHGIFHEIDRDEVVRDVLGFIGEVRASGARRGLA